MRDKSDPAHRCTRTRTSGKSRQLKNFKHPPYENPGYAHAPSPWTVRLEHGRLGMAKMLEYVLTVLSFSLCARVHCSCKRSPSIPSRSQLPLRDSVMVYETSGQQGVNVPHTQHLRSPDRFCHRREPRVFTSPQSSLCQIRTQGSCKPKLVSRSQTLSPPVKESGYARLKPKWGDIRRMRTFTVTLAGNWRLL